MVIILFWIVGCLLPNLILLSLLLLFLLSLLPNHLSVHLTLLLLLFVAKLRIYEVSVIKGHVTKISSHGHHTDLSLNLLLTGEESLRLKLLELMGESLFVTSNEVWVRNVLEGETVIVAIEYSLDEVLLELLVAVLLPEVLNLLKPSLWQHTLVLNVLVGLIGYLSILACSKQVVKTDSLHDRELLPLAYVQSEGTLRVIRVVRVG